MTRLRSSLLVATLVALAFLLTACSGEDPAPLSCGPYTELEDGQCVPVTHGCEEGQILTNRGECADEDSYCGDGTSYDSGLGKCVFAGDVQCGEGTIEQDNRCVPQDLVTCGEGTVLAEGVCRLREDVCGAGTTFDDQEVSCNISEDVCDDGSQFDVVTEKCVYLNIVECGEDTIEVDDQCVPMTTFADNLAANADIDHSDGAAIAPDDEDQFVFTGVLDDELTQSFELEGIEGQWLEITIYSRGLPSPGFSLDAPIGNWERAMPAGLHSAPARTVLIPATDSYSLSVVTTLTGSDNASDFGDPSWQYVGTVDVVDAPDTFDWNVFEEPLDGNLKHTTFNYIEIDVTDVGDVLITPTILGSDAHGVTLEAWTDATTFAERHELEVGQEFEVDSLGISTLYLHIDAVEFWGPNTTFEMVARPTEILEPGDLYTEEITVDEGEVIFMSHESDEAEPVAVTVSFEGTDQLWLQEVLAANRSSFNDSQTRRQFHYAQQSGTYAVTFQNISPDTINNFVATTTTEEVPVFEVPPQGFSDFYALVERDEMYAGDWAIAVIDTPNTSIFDITLESGSSSPRLAVYDSQRDQIAYSTMSGGDADVEFHSMDGGVYYVTAQPWSTFTAVSDPEFTIQGGVVQSLDSGEIYEEIYTANTFDILIGEVIPPDGGGVDIRLINPDGIVIFEEFDVTSPLQMVELLPGPGDYTVQVENPGNDFLLGLNVDLEVGTTFDTLDVDGPFSHDFTRPSLTEGSKEYLVMRSGDQLAVDVLAELDDDEEVALRAWSIDDRAFINQNSGVDDVLLEFIAMENARYVIEVEALTDIATGYDLSLSGVESTIFNLNLTNSTPTTIPEGGIGQSTVNASGCSTVLEIDMDVDITHDWRGDLIVSLVSPSGDERFLKARYGGSTNNIVGNFNQTLGPNAGFASSVTVEPINVFEDSSGSGIWTLKVEDDVDIEDAGTIESWTLNLTCQG